MTEQLLAPTGVEHAALGFSPEEIDTAAPTRAARLKWVIVVDETLPAGRAVNAAICAATATALAVPGLQGPAAIDADGQSHPGLPWAGCTILAADAATITTVRGKAAGSDECFVSDVPSAAQHTRVYDEYRESVATERTSAMEYYAVSIVGPRKRVDRIVGRLDLMA
jgi:hypothetical protein